MSMAVPENEDSAEDKAAVEDTRQNSLL